VQPADFRCKWAIRCKAGREVTIPLLALRAANPANSRVPLVRIPLMLKYLRIAITALSLSACVLLIALWVRSYSAVESWQAEVGGRSTFHIQAARRGIIAFTLPDRYLGVRARAGVPISAFSSVPVSVFGTNPSEKFADVVYAGFVGKNPSASFKSSSERTVAVAGNRTFVALVVPSRRICVVPFWASVAFSITIATIPWLKWSNRFSLRTLLIATTMVAVALGTIVLSS